MTALNLLSTVLCTKKKKVLEKEEQHSTPNQCKRPKPSAETQETVTAASPGPCYSAYSSWHIPLYQLYHITTTLTKKLKSYRRQL